VENFDRRSLFAAGYKNYQRTFNLYVRFPKSEWPKIKKAEKFDEEGNKIFEEFKKVYQEKYF